MTSEFRTIVQPLKDCQGLVTHEKPVMLLGSCFTDNIGACLLRGGFRASVNPCGTLYNPASIASSLLDILYERPYTRDDLFQHEGLWHSWNHHSRFSGTDPDAVVEHINQAQAEASSILAQASTLFVTFGTSWIFRLTEEGRVVANCHKKPASLFQREMLNVQKVYGLWKKMLRELQARYPELKTVFTVSPIRHLADGAHGNQVSKSTLLLAIDQLTAEFKDTSLYFPAYEIMMDDLRDYRFYAADMLHPSPVAVGYIYDIFCQSFMTSDTVMKALRSERQARREAHRPLHDTSENK
ncbi:GSCFA domain-containing protein [uncultured Muribaculum sp.]|uniref:GSCFA domain-containing protein n=1 Tax=uncultured Muribaculum sp. TaxID=1918613 RepID=UPI0025F5EA21|nr:GSCFA domain-containing protein [uncultured Muribaculum sp.]